MSVTTCIKHLDMSLFMRSILVLNYSSVVLNVSMCIHYLYIYICCVQGPSWRRCTTCGWSGPTCWTSVNTVSTAAGGQSWGVCRRPCRSTPPPSVGWCCWWTTGSTPTAASREVRGTYFIFREIVGDVLLEDEHFRLPPNSVTFCHQWILTLFWFYSQLTDYLSLLLWGLHYSFTPIYLFI